MAYMTDYTKTADQIQVGWNVNLPNSYGEFHVTGVTLVADQRQVIFTGHEVATSDAGLPSTLSFFMKEKVTAKYFVDEEN